jgi:hypothetical protein
MDSICKKGFILKALLIGAFVAPLVSAGSLELPTTPLIAGANVEPNLMLLLDSSGSMNAIVEQESDDGYDADTDYYDCSSVNTITSGSDVRFSYFGDTAYISTDGVGGYHPFGNSGGDSTTTSSSYCFADQLLVLIHIIMVLQAPILVTILTGIFNFSTLMKVIVTAKNLTRLPVCRLLRRLQLSWLVS